MGRQNPKAAANSNRSGPNKPFTKGQPHKYDQERRGELVLSAAVQKTLRIVPPRAEDRVSMPNRSRQSGGAGGWGGGGRHRSSSARKPRFSGPRLTQAVGGGVLPHPHRGFPPRLSEFWFCLVPPGFLLEMRDFTYEIRGFHAERKPPRAGIFLFFWYFRRPFIRKRFVWREGGLARFRRDQENRS